MNDGGSSEQAGPRSGKKAAETAREGSASGEFLHGSCLCSCLGCLSESLIMDSKL